MVSPVVVSNLKGGADQIGADLPEPCRSGFAFPRPGRLTVPSRTSLD